MDKSLINIFIILFHLLVSIPSYASTVSTEIIHSQDQYQAGSINSIIIQLHIKDSRYIHGIMEGGGGIIPTTLSFNNNDIIQIEDIRFPKPEKKKFDYTDKVIEVYSGSIRVFAILKLNNKIPAGEFSISGKLSYQACSAKVCFPPEEVNIEIPITVVPQGTSVKDLNQEAFKGTDLETPVHPVLPDNLPGMRFWLKLILIFSWGLALNLTPCIYPLIPITVSYFGGKSGTIAFTQTILHGILYLAGLSVTNSILGVTSALSGGMLGSALQIPLVLIFIAFIMTILGLSFFGFWEIRIPGFLNKIASKNYKGYFGTFFMGLSLGIVAAPCAGPIVLSLFTYVGQLGDPFLGFLYFFILSIGMGLPLCVLAVFSGAIDKLPVSGDWMLWIKKIMGWILIGMAAYYIGPLITNPLIKSIVIILIIISAGVHLGWIDKTGRGKKKFLIIKKVIGVIIIISAFLYIITTASEKEVIEWRPYYNNVLIDAEQMKMPLIIDLYADWCLPCKEFEIKVFHDPEVIKLSKNFIMVRLDMTHEQPFHDEFRHQYKIPGVPTVLFFNSKGREVRELRVEYLVDRTDFLERMKKILEINDIEYKEVQ